VRSTAPTLPSGYVSPVYESELIKALRLIQHATAPTHNDGAYHEAAYEIASDILKQVDKRLEFEKRSGR
jgi:hypothetical protein